MGADMSTQASTAEDTDLQGLSDPEFFAHWAAVRTELAFTPATSSDHEAVRREYDAVATEYRRRLDGAA